MNDLKQKFVISKEYGFDIGRVVFHRDLSYLAIGGGYYFFDHEFNTLYLYGKSEEFGTVTQKQVNDNLDSFIGAFENSKVVFEPNHNLSALDVLRKHMDKYRALELITGNDFVD